MISEEEFEDFPNYLIEVLSALGYVSAASFSYLTRDDSDDLFDKITKKVNNLDNCPIDDDIKKVVVDDIKRLWQEVGTFEIPPGHKTMIKLIVVRFGKEYMFPITTPTISKKENLNSKSNAAVKKLETRSSPFQELQTLPAGGNYRKSDYSYNEDDW